MKSAFLLPLFSVAIASAASTSPRKLDNKRLRHVEFTPRNAQTFQDTDSGSSSDQEETRNLFESETIDLYQDPCPTDNSVLTLMPTDPPTMSPDGDDYVWNDDGHGNDEYNPKNENDRVESTETTHYTKTTHYSTKSSKSSKSSKSTKGSKGTSKSSKSGSTSSHDKSKGYREGSDSNSLNKVSGMVQYSYAEVANSAYSVGTFLVAKCIQGLTMIAIFASL